MVQERIAPPEQQRSASGAPSRRLRTNPGETIAMAQGAYYLLTGIWPIASIRTFMLVTGPKRDIWLVRTVGMLAAVIGGALAGAGRRGRITKEVHLLGMSSAIGFAAVDLIYVLRRVISPVYLLDAIAELGIAAGWIGAWLRMRR